MRLHRVVQKKRLSLVLASALPGIAFGADGIAAEVDGGEPALPEQWNGLEFEDNFLKSAGAAIDLQRFADANHVAPGTYPVNVYVNGAVTFNGAVLFKSDGGGSAAPCFTPAQLGQAGLKLSRAISESSSCVGLGELGPQVKATYDLGEERLFLTVPQAMVRRTSGGDVDRSLWRTGAPALYVGHHTNAYDARGGGRRDSSIFSSIEAGVSLGRWSLKHTGNARVHNGDGLSYTTNATVLRRDVPRLSAQMELGEILTESSSFDSVRLRGVGLSTDERMLPRAMTNPMPVIRGMAASNARVEVIQRGRQIYETTVTPGPFVLDEIYDAGYGGDLEVRVTEANGSVQTFVVPFAQAADMLREGSSRFSVALGQADEAPGRPWVGSFHYRRGLSNSVTAFGAAAASEGYISAAFGVGTNTRLGALSAEVVHARSEQGHVSRSGESYQLRYSRVLERGTSVSVAAVRYNTSNFVGLAEHLNAPGQLFGPYGGRQDGIKSRLDLRLSESFGRAGSLYAAASHVRTHDGRSNLNFSGGYSASWKGVNLSLSAQRGLFQERGGIARKDTSIQATISFKLGREARSPNATWTTAHHRGGSAQHSAGVSGYWDDEGHLQYNVSGSAGGSSSLNASLGYQSNVGRYSISHSNSGDRKSFSATASGGVVLHGGGLTYAQRVGDTMGIVSAIGAAGAKVSGASNVRVDKRGYAVVPSLSPYRMNTVSLDPHGISEDIELLSTSITVAPRRGAIVPLEFKARTGRPVLLTALDDQDQPLPFGSEVSNQTGDVVGMVGQSGHTFLRVAPSDILTAQLDDGRSCVLPLPEISVNNSSGSPTVRCVSTERLAAKAMR